MHPPHPDPEFLLARAERVRELARVLLAGESGADDIAQDALVASLGRGDDAEPLPKWLVSTVKSRAGRWRRSRARRERRERAAARPEATPSAAELVERAWLQRTLVEAVVALEEPYRSAVLWRYFEGLAPREIATQLGVPVRTVQTRLARGLTQLRARLARQLGPETWAALAAPLVLGPPPAAPGPAASAATSSLAVATGGALVTTHVKFAAIAAAVAVIGVLAILIERTGSPSSPRRTDVAAVTALRLVEDDALAGPDTKVVEPMTADARAALAPGTSAPDAPSEPIDRERDLFGEVVDVADLPVQGADVVALLQEEHAPRLYSHLETRELPLAARAETDEAGAFRLRLEPGRHYRLEVAHELFATARLPDRYAGERVRVVLGAPASVSGRVTREVDGSKAAGARVVLWHRPEMTTYETRTDEQGAWRIDGLPAGTFEFRVESSPYSGLNGDAIVLAAGQVAERDVLLPEGLRVSGHVVDARTGLAIEGAEVGHSLYFQGLVRTDIDGAFALNLYWIEPSWQIAIAARAPGYACSSADFRQGQPFPDDLRIALSPGLRAVGRVLDARGVPLSDALVGAYGRALASDVKPGEFTVPQIDHAANRSGPDGRFILEGLSRQARHTLSVHSPGLGTLVVDFPDNERESDEIDFNDLALFAPAGLRGRVVDGQGGPLSEAYVFLRGGDAGRNRLSLEPSPAVDFYTSERTLRVDDLGRFAANDLGPGSYQVTASIPGLVARATRSVVLREGARSDDLEMRLETGISIEGRVVGPDGEPVFGALISVSPTEKHFADSGGRHAADQDLPGMNALSDGTFHLRGLSEGSYALEVSLWPTVPAELCQMRFEGIAAGSKGVVLELPKKATIRGRILGVDGNPPLNGAVQIDYQQGWVTSRLARNADAQGHFELDVPVGSTVDLLAFDYAGSGRARLSGVPAGTEGLEIPLENE